MCGILPPELNTIIPAKSGFFHESEMNMRILKLVFLVLAVVFVVAIYAVFVSLSEHREYSSGSLLSYLLTPTELSVLSERCEDKPVFVYSSADGPKSTVVTMSCTIAKHNFEQQMNSSGFQYINNGLYQKNDAQIQIITSSDEEKVTSVAFIGPN
jgi:hypothetical protein